MLVSGEGGDEAALALRADALQAFRAGPGVLAVQELKQLVPELEEVRLSPVPAGPHFSLFELAGPSADDVSAPVAWATRSHRTNLGKCLEEGWSSTCESVGPNDSAPSADGDNKDAPCVAAGMCICQGRGLLLEQFRRRFLAHMKIHFKPGTAARQLLADGKAVCKLRLSGHNVPDESNEEVHEVWLQVGYMLFNPYQPTFALMVVADPPPELKDHGERVYLKATCVVSFLDACVAGQ